MCVFVCVHTQAYHSVSVALIGQRLAGTGSLLPLCGVQGPQVWQVLCHRTSHSEVSSHIPCDSNCSLGFWSLKFGTWCTLERCSALSTISSLPFTFSIKVSQSSLACPPCPLEPRLASGLISSSLALLSGWDYKPASPGPALFESFKLKLQLYNTRGLFSQ